MIKDTESLKHASLLGKNIPGESFLLGKNSLYEPENFDNIKDGNLLILSIKTPNIIYKKYYVYITYRDDTVQDITEALTESNIKYIKKHIGVIYWNYFLNNQTYFNKKYLHILYKINTTKNDDGNNISVKLKLEDISSSDNLY